MAQGDARITVRFPGREVRYLREWGRINGISLVRLYQYIFRLGFDLFVKNGWKDDRPAKLPAQPPQIKAPARNVAEEIKF